jgi:hypothetical protein
MDADSFSYPIFWDKKKLLPKFASKGAAGINTQRAKPSNFRISPLAKHYMNCNARVVLINQIRK